MNKFKAELISIALSFSFNQSAFAIDSNYAKIANIRVNDWAVVVVMSGNNNGCGSNSIKFDLSLAHIQNILSVALAAQMADKKVKARYVQCSNSPWPNTATAKDLTIYTS